MLALRRLTAVLLATFLLALPTSVSPPAWLNSACPDQPVAGLRAALRILVITGSKLSGSGRFAGRVGIAEVSHATAGEPLSLPEPHGGKRTDRRVPDFYSMRQRHDEREDLGTGEFDRAAGNRPRELVRGRFNADPARSS